MGEKGRRACKLGEHQFMAIFEVKKLQPDRMKHFGVMVRDQAQVREVREKITHQYGLKTEPGFGCDFRDPGVTAFRWWIYTTNRWSGCFPMLKCRNSVLRSPMEQPLPDQCNRRSTRAERSRTPVGLHLMFIWTFGVLPERLASQSLISAQTHSPKRTVYAGLPSSMAPNLAGSSGYK